MIKGDKIKLVKPMGVFTNVGEVCEVTEISEDGVISFRFGGYHLGCMSYGEFEKYFEMVLEEEKTREWTKWEEVVVPYVDPFEEECCCIFAQCRHNGKKVQMKSDSFRSEATCHDTDEFSTVTGLDLASRRLVAKVIKKNVEEFAKSL